ncbi:MAG: hypothetical protein JWP87_2712 [Labilithrix sp.]|nr:hypothetical protein [Labilithrix sp.]
MTRARVALSSLLVHIVTVLAAIAAAGCGGAPNMEIGVAASPPPRESDEWPPLSQSPPDASTVKAVLGSADGAQVRVRAYLVAVTLPCPACNVDARSTPREELPGRTARPRGPTPPGCSPCPEPAATISDDMPTASPTAGASVTTPPLRAVAVAGGLQPRHVGHVFLLTGIFHANGAQGPELEVTDVRALDGR